MHAFKKTNGLPRNSCVFGDSVVGSIIITAPLANILFDILFNCIVDLYEIIVRLNPLEQIVIPQTTKYNQRIIIFGKFHIVIVELLLMSVHEMKHRNRAFVYIDVKTGKENKIMEELLKCEEVIEAHLIPGQPYDVLVVVELKRTLLETPHEKVTQFVMECIRKLRDVKDTNTIIPAFSMTKNRNP